MKIIELNETEAGDLMVALEGMLGENWNGKTIKFNIDGVGLKYKVGEGMWTPSVGHDLNQEVGA
jgi:hypothetical protein